jgi:hypothetical protein
VTQFRIVTGDQGNTILGIWKDEEVKSIYLSLMDQDLKGILPIFKLNFNQRTSLPLAAVYDKNYLLIFQNEFRNRYILSPVTEDIRNVYPSDLPESLNAYIPRNLSVFLRSVYLVMDKEESGGPGKAVSRPVLAVFTPEMKLSGLYSIEGNTGTCSRYQLARYQQGFILSLIEETGNARYIRFVELDQNLR